MIPTLRDAAQQALDDLEDAAEEWSRYVVEDTAHCTLLKHLCELHQQQQADEALLRQVLEDICGAKLCEVNSMSSRAEARRLLDKATNALRKRLGETK